MVQIYQGTEVTLSTTVSRKSSCVIRYYQSVLALTHIILETVTWMEGFSYMLKLQATVGAFLVANYITGRSSGVALFTSLQLIILLVSASVSISNTQSSTTSTEQDSRTTIQETINCVGPAEVEVNVALRQCTLSGSINVPVTVDGWVWFFYPSRRNGHYDCMQTVLVYQRR